MRAFCAFEVIDVWKGLFEHMPREKEQGIERAILGRGSHLAMHSQVREKSTALLCSHLLGVTLVMKQDKTSDRNGIQLVSKCLLHQGLTQCPTWFRHEGEGFGPPLFDPGLDTVGPRRIDE